MGRSKGSVRQGTIYRACTPYTAIRYMWMGIVINVEVRINDWRAGDKVLSVSAPVWEGGEVVTWLHAEASSL